MCTPGKGRHLRYLPWRVMAHLYSVPEQITQHRIITYDRVDGGKYVLS